MSALHAIFKRELSSHFDSLQAYVFMVSFLSLSGICTFYPGAFYERNQADLIPFFMAHPWLYLFLMPALAMGLWAEERRSGSIELLMTLPISPYALVLGKFLAAWVVAGVALLLTFPMVLTVNYLGAPDNGAILCGYLGSWLLAGGYLAIGQCMSALTKSQVIAFVLTLMVCLFFIACGSSIVLDALRPWAFPWLLDNVSELGFLTRFEAISRGVIDLHDLLYFCSLIIAWLMATRLIIKLNQAR